MATINFEHATGSRSTKPITELNISVVNSLVEESIAEGYPFVQKALIEWENSTNRFAKPGEKLWGCLPQMN